MIGEKPIVVTTSWDDGHALDLRVAELLRARGLPGTFYITIGAGHANPRLDAHDLRCLDAEGFEIGAHTVSHRVLAGLRGEPLWLEVRQSKQLLEQLLGRAVPMFCYPKGSFDRSTIAAVRKAGYEGARTVEMLSHRLSFSRYRMPTTVQAFPHPPINYLKNLGKRREFLGLCRYFAELRRCGNWVSLGKRLFDQVLREGGIWHLYGHSWELEETGQWGQLAEMLDYVSRRAGVTYATNGQVLHLPSIRERLARKDEAA